MLKKSNLCLFFLFSFFICFAFVFTAEATEKSKYTVLVYLVASDLESNPDIKAATKNINEMLAAKVGEPVNLLIVTGGTSKWWTLGISNKYNQYWQIKEDKMLLKKDKVNELSLAELKNLEDFLNWGIENYPAEKYALFFWDHGGGAAGGFGFDENHQDNPTMYLPVMKTALKNVCQKFNMQFELIVFDACLMAGIENAYAFQDFAHYLLASEEIVPGLGLDYKKTLEGLKQNPNLNGEAWGKVIIDSFYEKMQKNELENMVTMSLIDLKKVAPVVEEVKKMTEKFQSDIFSTEDLIKIAQARARSESYAETMESNAGFVDLHDFASNLQVKYGADYSALLSSIKKAVLYQKNGLLRQKSNGLSLFFPNKQGEFTNEMLIRYAKNQQEFGASYNNFFFSYTKTLFGGETAEKLGAMSFVNADPVFANKEEERLLSVVLMPRDVGLLQDVYAMTFYILDEKANAVLLNVDRNVKTDEKTGIISNLFFNKNLLVNGEIVSTYWESNVIENESSVSVPVLFNGKEAELLINWLNKENKAEVFGIWYGLNQETGMPYRDIEKPKKGDKITPIYTIVNLESQEETKQLGNTIVLKEDRLKITGQPLENGDYLYFFHCEDLFGRGADSNHIILTIE